MSGNGAHEVLELGSMQPVAAGTDIRHPSTSVHGIAAATGGKKRKGPNGCEEGHVRTGREGREVEGKDSQ